MSASYKPTLLAAIVRRIESGEHPSGAISLEALADEYVRMYWSQVVVFRLRHSPRDSAPPVMVKCILAAAASSRARRLTDVSEGDRHKLSAEIADVLPINVLGAFHSSKPERMAPLYEWKAGQNYITLPEASIEFVKENAKSLTLIANYFLARFLSKLNTVPHIVEKVEGEVTKRESLARYAAELRALGESSCFYCDANLDAGSSAVDHFIPWTFVFEDRLWNLVAACTACNANKSDKLPDETMLDRLLKRNKIREALLQGKAASHLRTISGEPELRRLFKLAHDEGWPAWQARIRGPA
jgi:5-methylcytosine-specific restriction endonuclease McrA